MQRIVANRNLRVVCFAWCAALITPVVLQAEEPARQFLAALRERGYFDMALHYLDQMQTSPLAPQDFKDIIWYERGVTLIQASRYQSDAAAHEKQLDEARAALQKFTATHKSHPLVSSANNQVANLLVERGRLRVERANRKSTRAADKTRLLNEARRMFDQAYAVFTKSRDDLKAKLKNIKPRLDPNDPADKKMILIRDQYQSDYLQARLLIPQILEEKADTYPPASDTRKKLLLEAADDYKKTYDDYRTRIAGLYAKMYLGRCYVKLKDYEEALSYFGDLLEQPNTPEAFRTLKKRTLVLAVDCWLGGDKKKKLYNDAIVRIEQMINVLRSDEAREPEWLYVRLALAKAYKAYADDVSSSKEKATALSSAKNHAAFVSKYRSDYQRQAQEFLAALRGTTLGPEEQREPATFAEARKLGKDALDDWQAAQATVADLKKQIAAAKGAKRKAELEQQLKAAQQQVEQAPAKSLKYFRLALELADENTRLDDVNVVRYFLCYWYFTRGDYYDAALVGEFVARRYPDAPGASQCAQIAMAAYLRLYKENQSADKQFETDRILSIGDYIIESWPDQSESVVAANTLIAFMINDKKLDKALAYLARIPVKSPQRGAAELSTGQALWSAYLVGMNRLRQQGPPEGVTAEAEQARLDRLKEQAKKILRDGIQRMRASQVNDTLLTAALSLAQIHVDTGEADAAVRLLEDGQVGPLTFVQKKHPATRREGFAVESYKTGLRAYIASLKPGRDNSATIQKAKGVMAALKQRMGDTPEGRKNLVATYIKLATDIKQQLDITPARQKTTLATGFASFLREVRSGADELSIHIWAADSFSKLGENFRHAGSGGTLSAEAKQYYSEAVKGFQTILDRGKKQPDWLPPDVRIQVLMQMAITQRQLGNYKEAIDVFEEILKERMSMLNVQVEAAKTFQQWASQEKSDKYYASAIRGDRKDLRKQVGGKPNPNYLRYIIWGWGRLSQVTARYPQYRDIFHQSRYNLALCRFAYAKLKKSPAEQKKWKEAAARDITLTQQLYPELGGAQWKPKYDKLLREIQQSLGQPVVGLGEVASAKSIKK